MRSLQAKVFCALLIATPFVIIGGCGGGGSSSPVPTPTGNGSATPTPTSDSPLPAFTTAPRATGSWRADRYRTPVGSLSYQLYVPAVATSKVASSKKVPLVLFFHGAGQEGTDNMKQMSVAETHLFVLPRNQTKYPCFFLAPQTTQGIPGGNRTWSGLNWTESTSTQRETATVPMQLTLDLLRSLKTQFPSIDEKRIYVTGISMGGFGTWEAITREPETFAAAIPVCGGGDPATSGRIASLPVWAWHDTEDEVISVNRTRQMVEAMRAAGGEPRYNETTRYGHSAWRAAYNHGALLPWLFAQKRP